MSRRTRKKDRQNKYLSLADASRLTPYSQEYLSLRARQGVLKAEKRGRNWFIKREWLEEYLKKSKTQELWVNSPYKVFKEKRDYLTLKEAANGSPYSEDYLGLRVRQGKLRAEKVGRNWLTTREWLDEYIVSMAGAGLLREEKIQPVFEPAVFVAEEIKTGEPAPAISQPEIETEAETIFVVPPVQGISQPVETDTRATTPIDLSPAPALRANIFGSKLLWVATACAVVLIVFGTLGVFKNNYVAGILTAPWEKIKISAQNIFNNFNNQRGNVSGGLLSTVWHLSQYGQLSSEINHWLYSSIAQGPPPLNLPLISLSQYITQTEFNELKSAVDKLSQTPLLIKEIVREVARVVQYETIQKTETTQNVQNITQIVPPGDYATSPALTALESKLTELYNLNRQSITNVSNTYYGAQQAADMKNFAGIVVHDGLTLESGTLKIETTATSTFTNGIQLTSGCFLMPDGTCAGAGTGTVNSGLAGQLAYYASDGTALTATSSLFLATSGYFGLGTSSPLAQLDVYGNLILSGADRYFNFGDISGSSGYGFRDLAGTMQYKNNAGSWAAIGSGGGDSAWTAGSNIIYNATSTDSVAIGTSSPYAKLTVWGNGLTTGRTFEVVNNASSTLFAVLDSGYVGLGTVQPSARLDVTGVVTDATEGTEMITSIADRDFSSDSGDWATSTAWVISSGVANHFTAGANIFILATSSLSTIVPGAIYEIAFTHNSTSSSDSYVTVSLGNASGVKAYAAGSANAQVQVVAATNNYTLKFTPSASWTGTLDNISVKQITPSQATQIVRNSDGSAGLEIRSGGTGVNTFIGLWAGQADTSGEYNIALGDSALMSNISGSDNTAVGSGALAKNTTGSYNSALGENVLSSNTTGQENAAFGRATLANNVSGSQNSAYGRGSLRYNTSGNYNTALGYYAGSSNLSGSYNTILGAQAGNGVSNQSYSNNSFFGYRAGYVVTTGSNNLLLGYQAGDNLTSGSGNLIFGYNIDAPTAAGSNQLSIGNLIFGNNLDGSGTAISSGNIGIGTTTPNWNLQIASSTKTFLTLSDMSANAPTNGKHWFLSSQGGNFYVGTSSDSLNATSTSLRIDQAGNVGIGTTSPTEKLTISGGNISLTTANSVITGATGLTLQATGDTYGTVKLNLQNRSGVNGAMFEQAGTVDLVDFVFKSLNSQRNIRFEDRVGYTFSGTNGNPEFQIGSPGNPTLVVGDSASLFRVGNVGIGTSSPAAKLSVNQASTGMGFYLAGYANNTSELFKISTSTASATSTALLIDQNGLVGIGTTSPWTQLSINGNMALTGKFYDSLGSAGSSGYVLKSTGTATEWTATSTLFTAGIDILPTGTAGQTLTYQNSAWTSTSTLIILPSGFVGVGTTSPMSQLSVTSSAGPQLTLAYDNSNLVNFTVESDGSFSIDATNSDSIITIGEGLAEDEGIVFDGNAQDYYMALDDADDTFKIGLGSTVGTTNYLNITSAGNVGIGTSSPYAKLAVVGQIVAPYFTATTTTASTFPNASTTVISSTGSAYFNTSSGYTGIGTTSPWAQLSINAATGVDSFAIGSSTGSYLVVNKSGNVGVGTAAPGVKLDVSGIMRINPGVASNYNDGLRINDSSGDYAGLFLGSAAASGASADLWSLLKNPSNNFEMRNNSSILFTMLTTGYTGIGTTTPRSLLQVTAIRPQLTLSDTAAGNNAKHWFLSSQGGNFYVGTSSDSLNATSTYLTINNLGYLGIGTTSPAYKLDVNGIARVNGLITNGSLVFNGSSTAYSTLTSYGGFNGYVNVSGGLGTGGNDSILNAQRLTAYGNLTNIGSIQAGDANLTRGGTFAAQATYDVGTDPYSVAIGDLNGDGKADLVTTNYGSGSGNTVSVLLNNGNGVFVAHVTYAVGTAPYSVAIGDLNGDGKADLAVANNGGNNVSVLLNNGNGTFATQVTYAVGSSPRSVAIGDLNGDGKADLAVANNGGNNVSVLLNNGNGTFATQVTYAVGTNPTFVAIGDLNGDGKADLVTPNYGGTDVSVLLNNGNGTFATQATYDAGSNPFSIVISDFNNDGKADLATVNSTQNTVSVLLNNGNGTFAARVTYSTGAGTYPYFVATGDLNGDGKADLAVANSSLTNVSILLNNGNGTFAARVTYDVGANPNFVAIGDLNGDGKADLVTTNRDVNNVSVLLNQPYSTLFAGGYMGYASSTFGVIGIGTSTPISMLQVASTTARFTLSDTNAAANQQHWFVESDSGFFKIGTTSDSFFTNDSYRALTINSSGNVGLGTTTPNWNLQVAGTRPFITLSDTAAGANLQHWYLSSQGGNFYVGTSSDSLNATSTYLTINQAGNMGIGTTNPQAILHLSSSATTNMKIQTTGSGATGRSLFQMLEPDTTGNNGWEFSNNLDLSGNNNFAISYLNAGSRTYVLTIKRTGDLVGIGTTSPYAQLSASSTSAITGIFDQRGALDILQLQDAGSPVLVVKDGGKVGVGTTSPWGLLSINAPAGVNSFAIGSSTGTYFAVNSLGYVGIGTANPLLRGLTVSQNSTDAAAALINFNKSRGTAASPTTVANGDYTASFSFNNYDGSNYLNTAGFGGRVNGTVTTNSVPTEIFFYTASTNQTDPYNASPSTVRMVIKSTGLVGIGTTSPAGILSIQKDDSFIQLDRSATNKYLGIINSTAGVSKWFTGLRELSTNRYSFYNYTAASEALTLLESGNIGIGTTTPNWNLQIASSTKTFLTLSDMSANAPTNGKHWFLSSQGGNFYVGTSSDALNATSTYLTINNNGYVGIGTTSPTQKLSTDGLLYIGGTGTSTIENNLHVRGTLQVGNGTIYLTGDGISSTDGSISIFSGTGATSTFSGGLRAGNNYALTVNAAAPSNSLNISAAGNIGIGLAPNSYKLTVDGRINLDNQIYTVSETVDDWQIQTVDDWSPASFPYMAAPDSSNIFVSYKMGAWKPSLNGYLAFAKSADGGVTWATTSIDFLGDQAFETSIAAPDSSNIFIAYHHGGSNDLRFATSSDGGTTWATSTIDRPNLQGKYNDIAALDANTIYISYFDDTGDDLKFAKSINGGSSWATSTVDSKTTVNYHSSIALAGESSIFISYFDDTNDCLMLAKSVDGGSTWATSTVYSSSILSQYNAITAYDTNNIFITYSDSILSNLMLAKSADGGSTWATSTIDSVSVNQSSIKVIDVNNLVVSYYDTIDSSLRLAESTDGGATWTITVIDSADGVGSFNTLRVFDANSMLISYLDSSRGSIKLAKLAGTEAVTNVGIGTGDTGGYKLRVNGSARADGFVTGDLFFNKREKNVWRMYEDPKWLRTQSLETGLDVLTLSSSGNVGIGTTSPSFTFSVNGTSGGTNAWTNMSHSSVKENFVDVFTLDKINNLNIKEWQYLASSSPGDTFRHLSPFAEDFRSQFGLGNSDWQIQSLDVAGVALKGVQDIIRIVDLIGATTTTPSIYIDSLGNVGIGTSTNGSGYKLAVGGEVAAQGFVNVSTKENKTDIEYLAAADEQAALQKLAEIKPATYCYNNEDCLPSTDYGLPSESNGGSRSTVVGSRRLGLIAEQAPREILSADGKGVDLYKMATFTLMGVKALKSDVDTVRSEMDLLKGRLVVIEASSAQNFLAGSGDFDQAMQTMSGEQIVLSNESIANLTSGLMASTLNALKSLGLSVEQGIVKVKMLAAETIQTRKFVIDISPNEASGEDGTPRDPTIGVAQINIGEQDTYIINDQISEMARIFVTPESSVAVAFTICERNYEDVNINGDYKVRGFRVCLSEPAKEVVRINWWIIETVTADQTQSSGNRGSDAENSSTPKPSASPTPSESVSPISSPSATPEISSSPSASAEPTVTPEPSVTLTTEPVATESPELIPAE